jgi:4-aminobutyrate aminotransferase / (S)-3-amino-2-methylpropionate transaminase / 5-aminovalerate transaminase
MSLDLVNRPSIMEVLDYMVPNTNSGPVIARGRSATVEDEDGRTYLDFEAGPGVASVGHCHPRVVAAIKAQAEKLLQSPGRFHSRLGLDLARRISELTGEQLKQVFFANSGAEAVDGATKLVMKHATVTGKRGYGIVAFEHSFHGRLSLPLSLTGNASRKQGFGPYAAFPGVVHISPPYFYRCPFGSRNEKDCADRAAQNLRDILRTRVAGEAAMLIAEPILGVGGVIVPPDNYWPQIAEICAENKITLVMDEVFTGFGRTGKMFAHQHWGIKPDIMTFAKAIGGGLPLGGFIASEEVGKAFESGDHFTTFGSNNQVGIAAGHAVLDILADEKLAERAEQQGEKLMEGFRRLKAQYGFVGDVRGRGLMIGLEVVKDRESKTPAAELTKKLQFDLREHGIIIGITGVHACVLRMTPPLVLTDAEVAQTLEAFGRVFARTAA